MTELKETVELMNSKDYKERFIAEYWQTKIRYEKLKNFNNKIEAFEMVPNNPSKCPKHDVPLFVLRAQQKQMEELLHTLEIRALLEDIDLNLYIKSNDTIFKEK